MPGFSVCIAVIFLLAEAMNGLCADLANDPGARSAELSALGDRMFRAARFDEAEAAYAQALDLDRRNVQGHLGMGKIASLLSDPQREARHFSAAYQIAPRDPDAILAFAGVVESARARQTLLRNFLALSSDARTEDVRARLRIAEQMGTTPVAILNSPYQSYRIPISNVRAAGSILRARINGGRELKLILDTGATGIVLNGSAGSELELEYLADAALSGYGSSAPKAAHIKRAASFETGALKIDNVLIAVSETKLTGEADGLIGLDVFRDFLIRMDPAARTLELTPFGEESQACRECVRAYRLSNLLLVRGTINGRADGYFVLDSGSPYSMVSRQLVFHDGPNAVFEGARGAQEVAIPSVPLSIRLGGQHLMDFEYATFDTSEMSSRNGIEIMGAIGYSVLRDLALTIDYRAGLVKLAKSGRE